MAGRGLYLTLPLHQPPMECSDFTDQGQSLTYHIVMLYFIKTHGSESRGQEEADLRDKPVSYLQVAPL